MSTLDSPLEALTLDYSTYAFLTALTNAWAWLAVITAAAVSFWRIRALSSLRLSSTSSKQKIGRSQDAAPTSSAAVSIHGEGEAQILSALAAEVSSRVLDRGGSTKTKFSLYYKEEEDLIREDDGERENEDSGCEATVVKEKSEKVLDDWERMMVLKMGDLGWYCWQDTAVLDGSVVRLWDGRRPSSATALVVDGRIAW